eukprot:gene8651-9156_t
MAGRVAAPSAKRARTRSPESSVDNYDDLLGRRRPEDVPLPPSSDSSDSSDSSSVQVPADEKVKEAEEADQGEVEEAEEAEEVEDDEEIDDEEEVVGLMSSEGERASRGDQERPEGSEGSDYVPEVCLRGAAGDYLPSPQPAQAAPPAAGKERAPRVTLFVSGFPPSCTPDLVRGFFKRFGDVRGVANFQQGREGQRGQVRCSRAWVVFCSEGAAARARTELNRMAWPGPGAWRQRLVAEWAREQGRVHIRGGRRDKWKVRR